MLSRDARYISDQYIPALYWEIYMNGCLPALVEFQPIHLDDNDTIGEEMHLYSWFLRSTYNHREEEEEEEEEEDV